jgi:hypothetical protein
VSLLSLHATGAMRHTGKSRFPPPRLRLSMYVFSCSFSFSLSVVALAGGLFKVWQKISDF